MPQTNSAQTLPRLGYRTPVQFMRTTASPAFVVASVSGESYLHCGLVWILSAPSCPWRSSSTT